jgi:NADH-quinone oxidoreductase subunit H
MQDGWWRAVMALLVWPGLVGGALLGWLYLWIGRKLTARLQGRQGPPFYQPFFDFIKLMGKRPRLPGGVGRGLFYGLPLASLAATACALALIPAPGNPTRSFAGDLVVLLYLLEVPALCEVLAGYSSRSLYGQVSAARESFLILGYNLPFLAALIALAVQVGSFRLGELAVAPPGPVHLAAAVAFLLAVPARLGRNPFSIANAEQELVGGSYTEYNGPPLALFELSHTLQLVVLVGLFVTLCLPLPANPVLAWALYLALGAGLVVLIILLAAATARLKIQQAFRFYWSWGALAAAAAMIAVAIW